MPQQFFLNGTTSFADPGNWHATSNTIDCIGSGGAGSGRISSSIGGVGGGGGAFSRITNRSPTFPVTLAIPAAGAQSTCVFGTGAYSCIADFGRTATITTAGAGGTVANSTGDTEFAGGSGFKPASGSSGGGGGGAAGFHGAGATPTTNIGGTGDNGNTAAPAANTAGNNGTQYDSTHGSGSGGSGRSSTAGNGSAGGAYGGGGGGSFTGVSATGGAGGAGLIMVQWNIAGDAAVSATSTLIAAGLSYPPGAPYDNVANSTGRSDSLVGRSIAASFTATGSVNLTRLHLRLSR